jgi:hypothetical protein
MARVSNYQIKNLREIEDMAIKHGFSESQQARFPREDLGAEATGLAYHVVRAGKRQPFAPMDAIRVAPHVTRAFEAGPDDLELLVFGPHHDHDAEPVQDDFWAD